MNADGKSDESVVPTTSANKDGAEPSAELNQERLSAVRNTVPSNLARTPSRNKRRSSGLHGVREAARRNAHRSTQSRDLKFTALLHHINEELLNKAQKILKAETKKETIEKALEQIVNWHKSMQLVTFRGKIDLNIDLDSLRKRQ